MFSKPLSGSHFGRFGLGERDTGIRWVRSWVCPRTCLNGLENSDEWRMASSGMLRRVALVRTDVSGEMSASIIRVTIIDELGTTLAR
jgi:hypothetical protein